MTLVNCLFCILLRGLAIFHVYNLLSILLRRFLHHSLSHEHLVLLLCIIYLGLVGNSIFKLISDAIRSVFEMGLKILRISLIITGCITICRRQILLYFGSAILIILFGQYGSFFCLGCGDDRSLPLTSRWRLFFMVLHLFVDRIRLVLYLVLLLTFNLLISSVDMAILLFLVLLCYGIFLWLPFNVLIMVLYLVKLWSQSMVMFGRDFIFFFTIFLLLCLH